MCERDSMPRLTGLKLNAEPSSICRFWVPEADKTMQLHNIVTETRALTLES